MNSTMQGVSSAIGLIGGIGLTEVHVYAQRQSPDGKFSGCPHVHAVTDEAYYILRGSGSVEFHDREHGFRTLPLEPGTYMHFPPLMVHRLVSNGDLVVLGMMGNAGLAERGEARIYFGKAIDDDPTQFAELQSLPKRFGIDGALERRDRSVSAYMKLMQLWQTNRPAYFAELNRFIAVHGAAMSPLADAFAEQVEAGPIAWAEATRQRINQLPAVPRVSSDVQINLPRSEHAFGMCGVLRPMLKLQDYQSGNASVESVIARG